MSDDLKGNEGVSSGQDRASREGVDPMIYLVIPCGVYDHGVVGVFRARQEAREFTEGLWRESDGYHQFRIEEWPLDARDPGRGPMWFYGGDRRTPNPPRFEFVPWKEVAVDD